MGDLFGSKSTSSSDEQSRRQESSQGQTQGGGTQGPWGPQQTQIKDIWREAWDVFDRPDPNKAFDTAGNKMAGWMDKQMAPGQGGWRDKMDGLEGGWNAARDREQQQYGQWQDMVSQQMGQIGGAMNYASDFAANDPYLNQSIDQSWDNVQRMLGQKIGGAGGIDHMANSGGNMSSSRAGVAEGLARSEAGRYGQEAELGMRQDAFNTGLSQHGIDQAQRQGIASMLKTNGMGELLAGQANLYGQDLEGESGLYGGALDLANADRENSWSDINNLWNIIGGNQWGNETTKWGRAEENTQEQGTKHTEGESSTQDGIGKTILGIAGMLI